MSLAEEYSLISPHQLSLPLELLAVGLFVSLLCLDVSGEAHELHSWVGSQSYTTDATHSCNLLPSYLQQGYKHWLSEESRIRFTTPFIGSTACKLVIGLDSGALVVS